jgi:hypothetical protein
MLTAELNHRHSQFKVSANPSIADSPKWLVRLEQVPSQVTMNRRHLMRCSSTAPRRAITTLESKQSAESAITMHAVVTGYYSLDLCSYSMVVSNDHKAQCALRGTPLQTYLVQLHQRSPVPQLWVHDLHHGLPVGQVGFRLHRPSGFQGVHSVRV